MSLGYLKRFANLTCSCESCTSDFRTALPFKHFLIILLLHATILFIMGQTLHLLLLNVKLSEAKRDLYPQSRNFFLFCLDSDVDYCCGTLPTDSICLKVMFPASRIRKTWIAFLHQRLCALPIWPSRHLVNDTMLACFKSSFPITRVIIDCIEFLIERPSSCRSQSITFSNYKNHNTATVRVYWEYLLMAILLLCQTCMPEGQVTKKLLMAFLSCLSQEMIQWVIGVLILRMIYQLVLL